MDYYEAIGNKGKAVMYHGEEYILLQVHKRKLNLAPGIPNPFVKYEYDGMIYRRETNSAKMVPIEGLEAVQREPFRMRLRFGEEPAKDAEEIRMNA